MAQVDAQLAIVDTFEVERETYTTKAELVQTNSKKFCGIKNVVRCECVFVKQCMNDRSFDPSCLGADR